jgi:hypothetical protein
MAHRGSLRCTLFCVPACWQSPARDTIDAPQHGPAKTGSRSAPSRQRLPMPHVRVHPRAAWHRCRLLLLPAMRRVRSRLVATRAARGNGATTVPADHLIHRNQPSPSTLVAASCTAGRVHRAPRVATPATQRSTATLRSSSFPPTAPPAHAPRALPARSEDGRQPEPSAHRPPVFRGGTSPLAVHDCTVALPSVTPTLLFASLDAAAHGAHERAGEFRREHSAVRPGVADVRR